MGQLIGLSILLLVVYSLVRSLFDKGTSQSNVNNKEEEAYRRGFQDGVKHNQSLIVQTRSNHN